MSGITRWSGNLAILVVLFCFAYVGQALIKHGLKSVGEFSFQSQSTVLKFFMNSMQNKFVLMGGFTVGLGFLLWMAFLSRVEISQALPMLSLSYVPWLFIGRLFFNERISVLRVLGVVLITLGVFFVGYSKTSAAPH